MIGRVTFAIGLGFAVLALVALRAHARWASAALTMLCYLGSPLAGLFLGLVLAAVAAVDKGRRVHAVVDAALLLASGVATALLFPSPGLMHFGLISAVIPTAGCALAALLCRPRIVRVAAVLTIAATALFMIVPGAVGSNIERLAWVCAVPVLVACAPMDRRRLTLAVLALAAWPAGTLILQIQWVPDPTTQPSYYTPLLRQLAAAQSTAGPAAVGERVEVLDTSDHSGSLYVARAFSIARGWDRQADMANNPIFYRQDALTANAYHAWLRDLAVGWVALPADELDYASQREAHLINHGLPYLELIWSSRHWRLYRVRDPAPLVTGATVTAIGPDRVVLRAARPETVLLRVRWTPYLRAVGAGGRPTGACVTRDRQWSRIRLPAAGQYSVLTVFDLTARFDTDDPCPSPSHDRPPR